MTDSRAIDLSPDRVSYATQGEHTVFDLLDDFADLRFVNVDS